MTKGFLKFVGVVWVVVALCTGCTGGAPDTRLQRAAALADSVPGQALAALDSIDRASLSEADGHYYDFLTIKAGDEAYVTHTSDSLVRSVIDYYSEHGADVPPYAEVLYYGGRVYSDLGDLPTALDYFQQAVDAMDGAALPYSLRCNILSQTGRLLSDMRLYKEAVPYIKRALKLEREHTDTIKTVYDLQLLAGAYRLAGDYSQAEKYLKQSLELCPSLPEKFKAKSLMALAYIKYKTGDIDSAVLLVKDTPYKVGPISRNHALGYAAAIYQHAGMLDSAYLAADILIHSPESYNKLIGYHNILCPKLRKYVPSDSHDLYFTRYLDLLQSEYDQNQARLTINQQSKYNYSRHEMARVRAEQSNDYLQKWLMLLGFVMLIFVIAFLLYKNHNQRNIIKLKTALANLEKLKLPQPLTQDITNIPTSHTCTEIMPVLQDDVKGLREQLKQKICSLLDNKKELIETSPVILQSDAYRELNELICQRVSIKDPKLWNDLEATIHKVSPNFKSNLTLLTNGRLTDSEYHTAILIKCGVNPKELALLMGRAKGTISKRRESMCLKLLDEQLGASAVDYIIRLL